VQAKVKEVVDKYKPDVVYFDSRAFIISEQARRSIVANYYLNHPEIDGIHHLQAGGFPCRGRGLRCRDRRFRRSTGQALQTDDRLEDNVTWCIVQEPKYKNAREIVHQLCDVVAKNGNLLLNVGPDTDGSFHPDAQQQLFAVGDWLAVCGEAIYATRPWKKAGEGPRALKPEGMTSRRSPGSSKKA
jgi:alpha-L-fucosidase